MKITRPYILWNKETMGFDYMRLDKKPIASVFGDTFAYAIGPFKTARAAKWAQKHGHGNPHFQHVNDAERLSKIN